MKRSIGERFRARFEKPYEWLGKMGVSSGGTAADIGAGGGFYTITAAETVGSAGRVYAVEPDAEKSEKLGKRVAVEKLENVILVPSGAEDLRQIPSDTVDVAFSVRSFHHFSDKHAALNEIKRVLKPGGVFYLRDIFWGQIFRHGTRREEVPILSNAGFQKVELLDAGRSLRARLTK
ncbi:MAG: class I SAM-dependent methyltransferase [Thaumarchaeota archaeon]|nr:class I SAM-dependent methyltransferase [Nitrososphaerota archaeon]